MKAKVMPITHYQCYMCHKTGGHSEKASFVGLRVLGVNRTFCVLCREMYRLLDYYGSHGVTQYPEY